MAALFLLQTFVGAASQHYRAEIAGFFGLDLASIFPYNLMRTWHVQLAIFWVATSFVAAGIFLAPMIARREPKHQGQLAFALLGYEGLHGRPAALAAGGGAAVLGSLAPGANYRPLIGRVAAALEEAPWPVSRSLRWTS